MSENKQMYTGTELLDVNVIACGQCCVSVHFGYFRYLLCWLVAVCRAIPF